jgi:hypothetical protein
LLQRNNTCTEEEMSGSRTSCFYFPMRPFPFLGGAEDVILDVCMSSPMYLGVRELANA